MTSDIVILTVVPRELQALRRILSLPEEPSHISWNGTRYWFASVPSFPRGPILRIGLTCIGLAGNSEASAATTEALLLLRPKISVLVGIAAGIRGKVRIGEVVLGDRVLPYEKGEFRRSRKRAFVPEGISLTARHDVIQALAGYSPDSSRLAVQFARGGGVFTDLVGPEDSANVVQTLTLQVATVASGEKLLRDPSVLRRIQESQARKTRAGDMEAWGFAFAAERLGVAWLVSRGISDFGDKRKADAYQLLAAATAGTVALDFLQTSWSLGARRHRPSAGVLKATIPDREMLVRRSRRSWQAPVEFDLRVRLSSGGGPVRPEQSERLSDGGPVAIVGRAGSGKTQYLLRAAAASQSGDVRYFDLGGALRRVGSEASPEPWELLSAAQLAGTPGLEGISADTFLFVDGFDEIDPTTASDLLSSLWSLSSKHGARVMVADRQENRDERYQVAHLQAPRSPADMLTLPSDIPAIPLFMDLRLHLATTGNKELAAEPSTVQNLLEAWMASVFRGYRKDRLLAAELALAIQIRDPQPQQIALTADERSRVLVRLEQGGIVLPHRQRQGDDSSIEFRSLLVQDYLSSEALAALGAPFWQPSVFDEISRFRNSPDTIAFALGQMNDGDRVEFGGRVFDWSYRTLASALSTIAGTDEPSRALESLALVVGVKLAERAGDVFVDSSSEAATTLRILTGKFAIVKRLGADVQDIRGAVRNFHAEFPLIADWRAVVLRADGNVTIQDLERLGASQPLVGWAGATWLRAQVLSERIVANLEMLYHMHRTNSGHGITRWRIVHVLGAARGEAALETLMLAAESDAYIWARHGAVRSIFETIARFERQRRYATLSWLADLLPRLDLGILGRTIRRASLLRSPPSNWYEDLSVVAKAVERTLGESQWIEWAPWFSIIAAQDDGVTSASNINDQQE